MLEELRESRQQRLESIDAVETKLGVLFGFSAALVALGAAHDQRAVAIIVSLIATVAALAAAWGLRPRRIAMASAAGVLARKRDALSTAEDELIEWYSEKLVELSEVQESKVFWLRCSGMALAGATVITGLGVVLVP